MQIDTSVLFYENHLMGKNYFISSCCDLFRHLFYIYYRLLADDGSVNRKINNLTYADDTTLMAKSKEELKSLLMKLNEESEKSWCVPHSNPLPNSISPKIKLADARPDTSLRQFP